jgi:hypothetical protein
MATVVFLRLGEHASIEHPFQKLRVIFPLQSILVMVLLVLFRAVVLFVVVRKVALHARGG